MESEYPGASYLDAAQYTRTRGSNGTVIRIVIHDEEYPEQPDSAERVAQMFHTTTGQKSIHFVVDNNSVVQCVPLDCRAWHAPPNTGSVGIEHSGYASQTRAEWLDGYGYQMLNQSAKLTAWLCHRFKLPIRRLTPGEIQNGGHGICGHADVSAAFHQSDHTDPGPRFPWDVYLSLVTKYYNGEVEDDMPSLQEVQQGILYYELDKDHVNPLTMMTRTYDMVSKLTAALDPTALARAIAAELPPGGVDAQALTGAVAAALAKRLES